MNIGRRQKLFGIGPKGAVISIFLLMVALWVDKIFGRPKILTNPLLLKTVSVVLAVIGIGLLLWSYWTLQTWWVRNQLCTNGPFRWFRHPMYTAWITFILPAVALYLNSWIILLLVILIHLIWHRLVITEEKMMYENFQNDYGAYASRTGRFFPRIWNP